MRRHAFPLLGAFAGALFFVMVLRVETGAHWNIRQDLGCTVSPAFFWLNAPARTLSWVIPNRVIAPLSAGEAVPPPDPAWSSTLFVIWGLVWYSAAGFVVGLLGSGYWRMLTSSRQR